MQRPIGRARQASAGRFRTPGRVRPIRARNDVSLAGERLLFGWGKFVVGVRVCTGGSRIRPIRSTRTTRGGPGRCGIGREQVANPMIRPS